jgi:hypothetical protein
VSIFFDAKSNSLSKGHSFERDTLGINTKRSGYPLINGEPTARNVSIPRIEILIVKGFKPVKKSLLFVLSIVAVLSIFAFNPSKTYAAANTHISNHYQKVRPAASGGGCDVWRSSGDISAKACISFNYYDGYLPDGYVSFNPTSTVSSCQVSVILYDTNNKYLSGQSWDCTSAANQKAQYKHYGPVVNAFVSTNSAYAEVFVGMTYANHAYSGVGSDSPVQNYW